MPLETATYIPDLNTSNPAHTDGMNFADSHMRLIKTTLKNTFANFTDAALNASQATIDAAIAVLAGTGLYKFALGTVGAPTIAPLGNPLTGLYSAGTDKIDVAINGSQVLELTSAGAAVTGALTVSTNSTVSGNSTVNGNASIVGNETIGGTLTVTGELTNASTTFIGEVRMWAAAGDPNAYWQVLDGRAISRTTYAVLFALIGTTYGTGDGSTTFNIPDARERNIVGKGATNTLIPQYATNVLGTAIGEGKHTQITAELPAHNHVLNDPGHLHNLHGSGATPGGTGSGAVALTPISAAGGSSYGGTDPAFSNITMNNTGSGTAFNVVQPGLVMNYIMRVT